MGAAHKQKAVQEPVLVRQPVVPRIPFRDRFWYMHDELEQVHRRRSSERRRRSWRKLLQPLRSRHGLAGVLAVAAAAVLVFLLIQH